MRQRRARRPRLVLAVVVLLALAGGLGITSAGPAGAACAAPSNKQMGGTLLGEDGRYVSAFVGIELFDSQHRSIGQDGCLKSPGGYSHMDRVNEVPNSGGCCFTLPPEGGTSGESTWSATAYNGAIPSNAVYAWIEVYPKSSANNQATTWARYGGTMRRYVPIQTGIDFRLPLGCGLGPGGDNGSIDGQVLDHGTPIATKSISVHSRAADGPSPIMGFSLQGPFAAGGFHLVQLSPGQRYALNIQRTDGRSTWFENDYGSGIAVRPCGSTRVTIDIGYSPPRLTLLKGKTTVGVRRGDHALLTNSSTGGPVALDVPIGASGDRIVSGDWDGDGVDTLGVRHGAQFWLTNRTDGQGPFTTIAYGVATDTPVIGDWDGNGTDTIGIRRGNSYYLRNTNTSGPANLTFGYGTPSDTPVVGDWDGNGADSPGIRRGNSYYLRNTNTSGPANLTFGYGTATDQPIVGDWDGNGTDTPGVHRGNQFFLRNSNTSGAANLTFAWGLTTDRPLAGDWDGA